MVRLNSNFIWFLSGAIFIAYGFLQFIFFQIGFYPSSYSNADYESSFAVFLMSIFCALPLFIFQSKPRTLQVQINNSLLIFLYIATLIFAVVFAYLFPWGNFETQSTGLGYSLKAFIRHFYAAVSILFALRNARMILALLIVDLILLVLDPSRAFFVFSAFPKVLLLFQTFRNYALSKKILAYLFSSILALSLFYISTFRIGISTNFILFAVQADVVHSTYSAVQLFQRADYFSYTNFYDFSQLFSGRLSPLGGYFLPGTFFFFKSLPMNLFFAFISMTLIRMTFNELEKIMPLSVFILFGVILLLAKFTLINSFKLTITLILFSLFILLITRASYKVLSGK